MTEIQKANLIKAAVNLKPGDVVMSDHGGADSIVESTKVTLKGSITIRFVAEIGAHRVTRKATERFMVRTGVNPCRGHEAYGRTTTCGGQCEAGA